MNSTVEDITREIEFVTSGQPLVRAGEALLLEQIAEQWYDIRHLLRLLYIAINKETAMFVPNAQLQQGLLRKALCQPVHIRLEAQVNEETILPITTSGWLKMAKETPAALANASSFLKEHGILPEEESLEELNVLLKTAEMTEGLLDEALNEADYRRVEHTRPLKEGEVRFINEHLEIFFRKGLYPHNIFVQWADGSYGFVVFPGMSSREGTTLSYAQKHLTQELKVQNAVLLDNGGDVRLWYRGKYIVPSSEGREEVRSILALTTPKDESPGDAAVVW